jgi:hypothetical protein
MKIAELTRIFSNRTTLPVNVNDVLDCLKAHGNDDDIDFIGVDFDTDVLQGAIKIWHRRGVPYGQDVQRYVNIYYHRGHERDWQRLICCKELIHVLDPEGFHTRSPEEIEMLAARLGVPPSLENPMADGAATNMDRTAEWRAAALLFPYAAREVLMEPLKAEKITLADIARMADIPRKYVAFVMHDQWESIHKMLTADV